MKCLNTVSQNVTAILPEHVCSLLEESDVVIWLSQFKDFKMFPANFGRVISSFWDALYEVVKSEPLLLVSLQSAEYVEAAGMDGRVSAHIHKRC